MFPERAELLIGRDITEEHLKQLARFQVERPDEREFVTHTGFSAWQPREKPLRKRSRFSLFKTGDERPLNVVFAPVFAFGDSPGSILVYDPSRNALWSVDEQVLEREMAEGGYFHSLAKLNSEQAILETLSLQGENQAVTCVESASRFAKFPEPQTHGFKINGTDLHIGNVEFDFRIQAP